MDEKYLSWTLDPDDQVVSVLDTLDCLKAGQAKQDLLGSNSLGLRFRAVKIIDDIFETINSVRLLVLSPVRRCARKIKMGFFFSFFFFFLTLAANQEKRSPWKTRTLPSPYRPSHTCDTWLTPTNLLKKIIHCSQSKNQYKSSSFIALYRALQASQPHRTTCLSAPAFHSLPLRAAVPSAA